MKTLALALPPGFEYSRGIEEGVVEALETTPGWQVLQLPLLATGRRPVRSGMGSLGGMVTWAKENDTWIEEVAGRGIPVVICGGDWRGTFGVGTIVVSRRHEHVSPSDYRSRSAGMP